LKTVFLLSLLLAVLVATLSLYVRPWAYDKIYRLKLEAQTDLDISRFEPGQFYEFQPLHGVVFAEEVDHRNKRAKRVFVQTEQGDKLQVACAEEAHQRYDEGRGEQVLMFRDGDVYELDHGKGREIFMGFEQYNLPFPQKELTPRYRLKAVPTTRLMRSDDPEDVAEVQWRFSTPLSTVLMGLLGLLLSRTVPRRGKYARVFVAIVAYAVYHSTTTLARHWVEQGVVAFVPGLWWVQVLLAALVLTLLWRRGLIPWARA
jgi:lipopolysaccharide export system permease protein